MSWPNGFVVSIPGVPKPQLVDGTQSAASLLAERWPVTHGAAFQKALLACAAVCEGRACPATARAAFVDAAHEAGVAFL